MNRIHYLIALSALILASCNRFKEKFEYNADGTVKKKTIYTESNNDSYREVEYFDGKHIKGVHEYVDGIQHGRSFNYYPNGEIKSVFYYDMGHLTSIAKYFDNKGMLTDKGLFIKDSLIVKEEYFYQDDLTKVNVFSRIKGDFQENGSLLYNNMGLFGMDNSYYYIVSSLDSIPADDSLKVNVNFIARTGQPSNLALTLGPLDEELQFPYKEKTYMSDSMSLSFYYKPKKIGYNLILGKLMFIKQESGVDRVDEFVFYHDFLAY